MTNDERPVNAHFWGKVLPASVDALLQKYSGRVVDPQCWLEIVADLEQLPAGEQMQFILFQAFMARGRAPQ